MPTAHETSEAPTTVATESAKVKKAKKAKPAAKKTAKKPAKATKPSGIRKPQLRVLTALAKSGRALSRAEISKRGNVDVAMLNSYIGSHDLTIRAKNDKKVMPSLLTLGHVKAERHEDIGVVYTITASGRKALTSNS